MLPNEDFHDLEMRLRRNRPRTEAMPTASRQRLRRRLMEKIPMEPQPQFVQRLVTAAGALALIVGLPLFFWLMQAPANRPGSGQSGGATAVIRHVGQPILQQHEDAPDAKPYYLLDVVVDYSLEGYHNAVLFTGYEYTYADGLTSGGQLTSIPDGRGAITVILALDPDFLEDNRLKEGVVLVTRINIYDETAGEYINLYPGNTVLHGPERDAGYPPRNAPFPNHELSNEAKSVYFTIEPDLLLTPVDVTANALLVVTSKEELEAMVAQHPNIRVLYIHPETIVLVDDMWLRKAHSQGLVIAALNTPISVLTDKLGLVAEQEDLHADMAHGRIGVSVVHTRIKPGYHSHHRMAEFFFDFETIVAVINRSFLEQDE